MRRILIIACFLNLILYYCAFAFFDNILNGLAKFSLPQGFLSFLQFFITIALGFFIGFLIILAMRLKTSRNFFDLKVMLIAGTLPALALLLYETGLVNLIVTKVFNSSKSASEAAFYFFSITKIWTLWLGVSIGASVRIKFGDKKKYRHEASD
jgi:hypothetical protein